METNRFRHRWGSSWRSIVAIGAFRNDGNGTDAGHVRVYNSLRWSAGINPTTNNPVKIYPNPSTNGFSLNLAQNYQGIELRIMDVLGQIISTKKVESASQVEFEITGKPGLYLVEISTNGRLLNTVRIIKE